MEFDIVNIQSTITSRRRAPTPESRNHPCIHRIEDLDKPQSVFRLSQDASCHCCRDRMTVFFARLAGDFKPAAWQE